MRAEENETPENEKPAPKINPFKKTIAFIALMPVYFYRLCIRPLIPHSCRFSPTCSEYMIIAVKTHGVFKGGWLGVKRICRCNPLNKCDCYLDPVPPKVEIKGETAC
ncbi:MAG: membrane protein insertion efficiency factor YidD [Christensenellaceae bacterium]|jgi:putative membrane protein insertion efficiency factor|nr:membrane protein insertion efficiency factor YidD [Christensenellaceae bacterium]